MSSNKNQLDNAIFILKNALLNEKIPLAVFSNKLNEAHESFPEDYTIGMMNTVVKKMASSKNQLFITKKEIQSLYNKLHSRNTKFASLFFNEMGIESPAEKQLTKKASIEQPAISNEDILENTNVDHILAHNLNEMFGNKNSLPFSVKAAEKAKKLVGLNLDATKLQYSINIKEGNNKVLICNATFATPRGSTSVLIPIEIVRDQPISPEVFVSNAGVIDFSINNIKNYVINNSGQKLVAQASQVLQAITKTGSKEISSVDVALSKIRNNKENQEVLAAPAILGQQLEKVAVADVKNVEYFDPELNVELKKQFDTPAGIAAFAFGKETIQKQKSAISNYLKIFGFDNHQIKVSSSDDGSVSYAVSLNKTAFSVPMKVNSNKNHTPKILICNGSVRSFSKQSIQELMNENSNDSRMSAVASPLYDLKDGELLNIIRIAAAEENIGKADDALNVLANREDKTSLLAGFSILNSTLSGEKDLVKKAESKCNRIIKHAHSSSQICGHTNLPIEKVYQDKDGNCCPLYRKDIKNTSTGATFLAHKILF